MASRVNFCPFDGYAFILDEVRCGICGVERNSVLNSLNVPEKPPWRKMLWERQPYEDNYTDKAFLKELQKNVNMIDYDYKIVMEESVVVTQEVTLVGLFVAVMLHLLLNSWQTSSITYCAIDAAIFGLGFIAWLLTTDSGQARSKSGIVSTIGRIGGYGGALFVFSPVIGSLTLQVSDDTITTLSVICFIIHLYSQDYAYLNAISDKYSAPFALNAAIFASVMMASRLESHMDVFALISFSIQIFGLYPVVAHGIKQRSKPASWHILALTVGVTAGLLFPLSKAVAFIYLGACVFITFVSPLLLIMIMQYKDEIHGPWDEAVPLKRYSEAD